MLEQMRKHMNWMMWTILVLIIVTFLFFGIFPSGGGQGVAAKVNGDIITNTELNRVYRDMLETYRQIFKEQFNDSLAKGLRQQALRELVQNRLLVREAERVGLKATEQEIQAAIMSVPAFSVQGRFEKAAYLRYLDYINVKPSAFEENQREMILRRKLERVVEDGVDVTDDELRSAYASRNPKAKSGDFEKNRASFRQTLLAEKRRTAVDAFVEGLYRKSKVVIGKAEAGDEL